MRAIDALGAGKPVGRGRRARRGAGGEAGSLAAGVRATDALGAGPAGGEAGPLGGGGTASLAAGVRAIDALGAG